jgi:ABC-type uncharacterized transport system ATPase subunit
MDGVVQKTYVDGKLFFDIELDLQRQAEIEREKEELTKKYQAERVASGRAVTEAVPTANTAEEVER